MSTTAQEVGGFQAIEARLREQAHAEHPPTWMPEGLEGAGPGNSITGKVMRYTQVSSSYDGSLVTVMEIQGLNSGKSVSVWLYHTTLREEIKKLRPRPGEIVYIEYAGKQMPKGGGSEYHMWHVAVDRDEAVSPSFLPWEVPTASAPVAGAETTATGDTTTDTIGATSFGTTPAGSSGTGGGDAAATDDIPF